MFEVIILLIAGIGAGIVTGLAGASAVMFAAPLLIVFLGYPAYLAIGISLSIDFFASLISTFVYGKSKRIKIKPSLILLISSLIAVLIGSYFSKNIPSDDLGLATGIGIILAGTSIILKRQNKLTKKHIPFLEKYKTLVLILVGLLIGTIAGVFGAGGGIMILFTLIIILNYKTHEAIGTSVFLMIFIALFGGISHYYYLPFSIISLLIGAGGGIVGALFASRLANKTNETKLKKSVGITIIFLGFLLILKNLFIS